MRSGPLPPDQRHRVGDNRRAHRGAAPSPAAEGHVLAPARHSRNRRSTSCRSRSHREGRAVTASDNKIPAPAGIERPVSVRNHRGGANLQHEVWTCRKLILPIP
jgi:hypothetical protein